MGFLNRLKNIFSSTSPTNENPEHQLNKYMDSASERLREFSVTVSRSESELLTAQEEAEHYNKHIAAMRAQAENAALQGNKEAARQYLEQAYMKKEQLDVMLQDVIKLEARVLQLKRQYVLFKGKIEDAKEKRDLLILRHLSSIAETAANRTLSEHDGGDSALDHLSDEVLLSEAETEAARSTGQDTLDEEIERLVRSKQEQK